MKLGGDLVACVLGQVYSEVEKTMTGLERTPLMLEGRQRFPGRDGGTVGRGISSGAPDGAWRASSPRTTRTGPRGDLFFRAPVQ